MTRTRVSTLVIAAIVGLLVGFGIDQVLTSVGRATFTPSLLLPAMLVLLAVAVVLFALPIRRATTSSAPTSVDPFRAVRVVTLAKASSVAAAVLTGMSLGLLSFLLSRPVAPVGSVVAVIAAGVGALVLLVAALYAEHLCTIRKDDDDEQPGPDEPGFGLSHNS